MCETCSQSMSWSEGEGSRRVQKRSESGLPAGNYLVQVDEDSWRGSFELPADAGLAEPELLQFNYSAPDDLGNILNLEVGEKSLGIFLGVKFQIEQFYLKIYGRFT